MLVLCRLFIVLLTAMTLFSCSPLPYGYIDKMPRVYETVVFKEEGFSLDYFKGFNLKLEKGVTEPGSELYSLAGHSLSTYHLGGVRGDKSTSYIMVTIFHHGIDEYLSLRQKLIVEWNDEKGAVKNLERLNSWDYLSLEPLHLEYNADPFNEYSTESHFVYMLSDKKLISLIVSKNFDNAEIIQHADRVFEDISASINKIDN